MKTYKIRIKESISNMIAARQSIVSLFHDKILKQYDKIIFDFSEVSFVSRSAADQLFKEMKKTKYQIEIINLSDNLTKMLEIVEKTQNGSNRQYKEVPVIKFKNKTALTNFLSTI